MAFLLGPRARDAGYRLAAFETIGSTNTEAMERARAGDPGDLWVVARAQTAGRGRRGRAWETPTGNLAASLLKIVDLDPLTAATLGFVAGLSLDEALRRVAPTLDARVLLDGADGVGPSERDRLALKWPNDVLLGGAKLSGIMLEREDLGGGRTALVIGIGVNVAYAPDGLPYPATSLREAGLSVTADDVFAALAEAWTGIEGMWDGGRGFKDVRRAWLARAAGLGGRVAVRVGSEVVEGTFETLDDEGRLVVRAGDGTVKRITAGEVHFGVAATART